MKCARANEKQVAGYEIVGRTFDSVLRGSPHEKQDLVLVVHVAVVRLAGGNVNGVAEYAESFFGLLHTAWWPFCEKLETWKICKEIGQAFGKSPYIILYHNKTENAMINAHFYIYYYFLQ
jgi:hypothetical protein